VKAAIDLVGAGVKIAQEGYEVAAPVIKQGVDAVAPVVSEAVKVTTETAAPLLSKATPVVKVSAGLMAYIRPAADHRGCSSTQPCGSSRAACQSTKL
jgi:hypothetical protein